jgi:mRNA interferase MazF
VLLSAPEIARDQRFPMICVIPITSTPGEGALYPRLAAGASGLNRDSYALVDQIRAVDKRRVVRAFGVIEAEELHAIDEGVKLFLGME